jgi:DNA invertase Pin-like site-specific DNA recombinase
MYVCHACDNVYCVNPAHLFLGTQKQNLEDMARKGRSTIGSKNSRAKLTEKDVSEIKKYINQGHHIYQIAKKFGVTIGAIYLIKQGRRWGHVN